MKDGVPRAVPVLHKTESKPTHSMRLVLLGMSYSRCCCYADLFSAARTSLSGPSNDEFDVGVARGRHRLCKTPVISPRARLTCR